MYFFAGLIMMFVQGAFVRRIKLDSLIGCAQVRFGCEIDSYIVFTLSSDRVQILRFNLFVQCGLTAIVPAYVIIAFSYSQFSFFIGLALYAFGWFWLHGV